MEQSMAQPSPLSQARNASWWASGLLFNLAPQKASLWANFQYRQSPSARESSNSEDERRSSSRLRFVSSIRPLAHGASKPPRRAVRAAPAAKVIKFTVRGLAAHSMCPTSLLPSLSGYSGRDGSSPQMHVLLTKLKLIKGRPHEVPPSRSCRHQKYS